MYTLNPHFDAIVNYIGLHPWSTVKQIVLCIEKSNYTLWQAQVYNIVNSMLSNKVLVKKKGLLSLNMKRVVALKRFSTDVTKRYQSEVFLEHWEQRIYTANTFEQLNIIRSDLSSTLLMEHVWPIFYFDPHPYHILWNYEEEKSEIHKFTGYNNPIYYLFGSDTFLDKYGASHIEESGCTIRFANSPPFPSDTMIAVVGSYVYTIVLPQDIVDYFTMFFINTLTLEQFNVNLFKKVFQMKGNFSLTVKKDVVYAEQVTKIIQQYFE